MPASSYATPTQLAAYYGESRLRQWFGHLNAGELQVNYAMSLSAASGEMNAIFSRASYAVPVNPSTLAEPMATQLSDFLAKICCALACESNIAATVDAPEGLKYSVSASRTWLNKILNDSESLMGIPKIPDETVLLSQGRVGAVLESSRLASGNIGPGMFEAVRALRFRRGF